MRAEPGFLRQAFAQFNKLCFNGELPHVGIRISSAARAMGSLKWTRRRFAKPKPEDFTIWISDRHEVEQSVLEDTLIHEMIHLYIQWNGIKDNSAHGPAFRGLMTKINRDFGRHITVTHRLSDEERQSDRLKKLRVIMTALFNDGTRTVTVISPRYTKIILEQAGKAHGIKETQLWVSASSFFAGFPQSRTLKLYRISEADLNRELSMANRAEIIDGKFKIYPRS